MGPGVAYSFLAIQNGGFLIALGYSHSKLHQRFLALAIAGICSAIKGSASEPLRVAGKCPASPALWAGSRGTIKTIFPFREAPACGRKASIAHPLDPR